MTARFADEPQPTADIPRRTLGRRAPGRRQATGGLIDRLRWFWWLVALVGLLVVWLLLGLRWQAVGRPLTIAVVGVMPVLAVGPLVVSSLSAWLSRSPTLRVSAGLTVLVFLITTSPVSAVIGCGADDAAASGAEDVFTVYTANVWFEFPGGQPDQIAAAIAAADPEIVFLQEVDHHFLTALQADPLMARYPHRSTDLPGMPIEDLVWSKWPIERATYQDLANARLVEATVNSPSGSIVVTPIHLQAPISNPAAVAWNTQLGLLAAIDPSAPRILAGDFNATRDHQPFRHLLDRGWTDVHEVKGCGYDATWPLGRPIPPLMRLDHVLVSDHFEVLDVRLGDPGGSDHLPVIATLRHTS